MTNAAISIKAYSRQLFLGRLRGRGYQGPISVFLNFLTCRFIHCYEVVIRRYNSVVHLIHLTYQFLCFFERGYSYNHYSHNTKLETELVLNKTSMTYYKRTYTITSIGISYPTKNYARITEVLKINF